MKTAVILTNVVVSVSLAATGLTRMILRDPLLGRGYEWSTLMWILGLVSLFLIPLEICLIRSPKSGQSTAPPPSNRLR
ncbi:MAG: hypothetical protein A2147_04690 [Chloroflexi bacterium RBG_16_57_8]|nr:MAG: hypothetical protein A2147_04690 [Chloroflexi bacterium RBG_16_57_8]